MQIIIDTTKDSRDDIQLAIELLESVTYRMAPTDLKNAGNGDFTREQVSAHLSAGQPVTETYIDKLVRRDNGIPDTLPTLEQVIPHLAANQPGAQHTSEPDAVQVEATVDLVRRLPDTPTLAIDADTDTAGVKWDATLHSESRAKTADGTWRKRRTAKNVVSGASHHIEPKVTITAQVGLTTEESYNVGPELYTTSQGEAVIVPSPPVTVIPPPPSTVAASEQTVQVTIPSPPAAVFTPASTFMELMTESAKYMAARQITSKDVANICHEHGIDSFQECFHNTALIPSVHTAMHNIAVKVGV